LQDATISEYELEIADSESIDLNTLIKVISLSRNGSLDLRSTNFESIRAIAKSLGNRELCDAVIEFARSSEELSMSNVTERLSLAELLEVCRSTEIGYLASHFSELDVGLLKSFSHGYFEEVLESEKLRIVSEDSLLNVILNLGADYLSLLGHVRCEYLTVSGVNRLLNRISVCDVDGRLWSSLCRRLRLFVKPSLLPCSRFAWKRCEFDSARPLDGVIALFTRECGGNVHTNGIISITASSSCANQCHRVADCDWTGYWASSNEANSWIQFDFKARRISVTGYSIKSDTNGGSHLLNWSISGSDDCQSWTMLDQRKT
jgi:hypothetical protein